MDRIVAATEKVLIGDWRLQLKKFVTIASFHKGGRFTSTNKGGGPGGVWTIEPGSSRVMIRWQPGEAWTSLNLPHEQMAKAMPAAEIRA